MAEITYRGHLIVPKRDFGAGPGFLIDGKFVKSGFVAVAASGKHQGCNVMPAATWFQTVPEAKRAIDVLKRTRTPGSFWRELDKLKGDADRRKSIKAFIKETRELSSVWDEFCAGDLTIDEVSTRVQALRRVLAEAIARGA